MDFDDSPAERALRAEAVEWLDANAKRRELMRIQEYRELPVRHGDEFAGTDLLLAPKQPPAQWLPLDWRVVIAR